MICGKRVLAVIPARGGSKEVPRKNVRLVAGKPLLAFTIEVAKQSRYLDQVLVSSDDVQILAIAEQCGALPLKRPPNLALDETPGIDPVLHALKEHSLFDYVVLLQPTSPLRSVEDIDGAIEYCLAQSAPACVSICEAETSPFRVFELLEKNLLRRFMNVQVPNRRQDSPTLYVVNGAVYVAEIPWLEREGSFVSAQTIGYPMSVARSLDIDSELDLLFFEFLIQRSVSS